MLTDACFLYLVKGHTCAVNLHETNLKASTFKLLSFEYIGDGQNLAREDLHLGGINKDHVISKSWKS